MDEVLLRVWRNFMVSMISTNRRKGEVNEWHKEDLVLVGMLRDIFGQDKIEDVQKGAR